MLEKLERIFNHYRKKYELKTKLFFKNNETCCFNIDNDCISYDLTYIIEKINNHNIRQLIKQYNKVKKEIAPIFALLHEIGHATDLKYNYKQYEKEVEQISWCLYNSDYKYAMSQPFEVRANKFAKKELKKWIA